MYMAEQDWKGISFSGVMGQTETVSHADTREGLELAVRVRDAQTENAFET